MKRTPARRQASGLKSARTPRGAAETAATASTLGYRRVIARHAWTTAEAALRRSKACFLATATKDARAVIVETTKKGASAVERYALDPASMLAEALEPGTPPPEKPKVKRVDPLDAAFARERDELRAHLEAEP